MAAAYGVPARVGAPVRHAGRRGIVLGVQDAKVKVFLPATGQLLLCHPRWRMVWLEENGPARRLPNLGAPSPAPLLAGVPDEPGWSGC